MPVIITTAYGSVEDVLLRARAILNDAEVVGGDILTDTAPFTMQFVNIAYEQVQRQLAIYGVETFVNYAWLLGLPTITNVDPEARLIVSDSGTQVFTPGGLNQSSYATPVLPDDLIVPLKLWERQAGSTNFAIPMQQRNGGVIALSQQTFLIDWEWVDDTLQFRGALQSQDVKLKYEKHLPLMALVTDPVPIRGVDNAAAYQLAKAFAESRGSAIAPSFGAAGQEEISALQAISVRRRQRKKGRRKPYRGFGGRSGQLIGN